LGDSREELAVSFNGGKDSTVLLYLVLYAYLRLGNDAHSLLSHNADPFMAQEEEEEEEEKEERRRSGAKWTWSLC